MLLLLPSFIVFICSSVMPASEDVYACASAQLALNSTLWCNMYKVYEQSRDEMLPA